MVNTIGEALRAWREGRGLKIREAAAIANVDPGQWSKWENGVLDPSPLNRAKLQRREILTVEDAKLPAQVAA